MFCQSCTKILATGLVFRASVVAQLITAYAHASGATKISCATSSLLHFLRQGTSPATAINSTCQDIRFAVHLSEINSNWGRFPKHNGSVCVYADLKLQLSWPFFCLSGLMHSQREAYWMPGMWQCLTKGGYHIFQMSTVTTVTTNQPQKPGGGRMKTSKRIRIR